MDAKLNFIAMLTHLSEGANIYNILYNSSFTISPATKAYKMQFNTNLFKFA